MEKENCLYCLYSNYCEFGVLFKDELSKYGMEEVRRCEHPNSPYYEEIVSDKNVCRLFLDEEEYYRNKDLREKIINIKNNGKIKP